MKSQSHCTDLGQTPPTVVTFLFVLGSASGLLIHAALLRHLAAKQI